MCVALYLVYDFPSIVEFSKFLLGYPNGCFLFVKFVQVTFFSEILSIRNDYLKLLFMTSIFIKQINNIIMIGIEAIQIYFPKTFVDQTQYQKFKGVDTGKYTKGLGQLQMSFANAFQDVNSISLTVVSNLLKNHNIKPQQVGRLQIGTETLIDKSKSTKTVLMTLFKENHDIQGATSINACYGAMNALINTLNWMSSSYWDGRYGIVVAADLAVYQDGPARCTGGAGAIAILVGPNSKIVFNRQRASFMDHQYDFYKPIPSSQYPTVDGKLSISSYLKAVEQCYLKLKEKLKGKSILKDTNFYCFHTPFYKMVQKAFIALSKTQNSQLSEQEILKDFKDKVHPSLFLSQRTGNIYSGSLFSGLISLFLTTESDKLIGKNIVMFSYGSGLCSTMMTGVIKGQLLSNTQIQAIKQRLQQRIKVSPQQYTKIMLQRQQNFGKFKGKIPVNLSLLDDGAYYLAQIDDKWRRTYQFKKPIQFNKNTIAERLQNLNKHISKQQYSKFYKLGINQRIKIVDEKLISQNFEPIDKSMLQTGGLNLELADTMVQNVIGTLSLPLSIVPMMIINNKKYMVPMCIQEPSVVAACSSIAKFLAPYSFCTTSTPNVMIGQVHLPNSEINQIHKIISQKTEIIKDLNTMCKSMVERGGGVTDLRIRQLNGIASKQYVVDIYVNVCQAMGANITNTICERAKQDISKLGIKTGIAILTNYCLERKALSYFQIPVKDMAWKGVNGFQVAQKILQAFQFAKSDRNRATTHNKGIMNGIDAVCVATGQDWRAVQSAAHSFASRTGTDYLPLSHYEIIQRDGVQMFRGNLELPIAVGSKGGVIQKNPLYKTTMSILGNPTARQLAEILVSVGLAQNFAALRAMAIEGINKGHMVLHARTIAQKAGVPKHLIEQACKHMASKNKYTTQIAKQFLKLQNIPKL